jgi:hypothetical protein
MSPLEGKPLRIPPSNGSLIFDRAPCLPFSGGREANALRPRGHTPLDSPDDLFSAASSNEQIVGNFYPSGEPISLHLLRCGPIAVEDHVITSDRKERGDLIILRNQHEIATFATLFATESTATSTRE